jgi:hypothetical protein
MANADDRKRWEREPERRLRRLPLPMQRDRLTVHPGARRCPVDRTEGDLVGLTQMRGRHGRRSSPHTAVLLEDGQYTGLNFNHPNIEAAELRVRARARSASLAIQMEQLASRDLGRALRCAQARAARG